MTLYELYDNYEPLNNMIALLGLQPERMVVVGDHKYVSRRKNQKLIYDGQKAISPQTTVEFLSLNIYDINKCVDIIAAHIMNNRIEDCIVDLTGGQDMALFVMGIVCERLKVKAVKYRPGKHALLSLYGNNQGVTIQVAVQPSLTAMINAMGGSILRKSRGGIQDIEGCLLKSAEKVYTYIFDNYFAWCSFVSYFQQSSKNKYFSEGKYKAPISLQCGDKMLKCPLGAIKMLYREGLIHNLMIGKDTIEYRLPNEKLRHILTDHGVWLELYIYSVLKQSGLFDCVETGVVMCWDNDETEQNNVENEIDVAALRGIGQIFISCKLGVPEPQAIYELMTLTRRFGSRYAVPILVSSQDVRQKSPALIERAEKTGVTLLSGSQLLKENLVKEMRNICNRWGRIATNG